MSTVSHTIVSSWKHPGNHRNLNRTVQVTYNGYWFSISLSDSGRLGSAKLSRQAAEELSMTLDVMLSEGVPEDEDEYNG